VARRIDEASARPPTPDETLQVSDFGQTHVTDAHGSATVVYQVSYRIGPDLDDGDRLRNAPDRERPLVAAAAQPSWDARLAERIQAISDPDWELRHARDLIRRAHAAADSGVGERNALVLMTMAAEIFEALDSFLCNRGRLPVEWTDPIS
jgi:hypothetical protein